MTKGEEVLVPATIIECPPLKIYSVRAYTKKGPAHHVLKEIVVGKDKHLFRKLMTKKASDTKALDTFLTEEVTDVSILVLTQPSSTGIGRKKPDVVELRLGGSNEEIITFIKEHLTSGIKASEVFKEGDYFDAHAVTTGRGYQGSVKRFGVSLKHHKSEKGVRRVGALGSWKSQQHWQYRIAYPGQTGYHQRVQYNNQILKISDNPEEVNPKGGLINYGVVKNEYLLVLGSIQGPKKRLITLTKPVRLHKKTPKTPPTVERVITRTQQRR
jgi:large subunit ribosomal protein L3